MADAHLPPIPEMRLELVPVPVSDVDRAKAFYERIGFGNLHDTLVSAGMRVVQFTPPGSACAIVFGTGMGPISEMVPGSVKGLHLVVKDIEEAARRSWPAASRRAGSRTSGASSTSGSATLTATSGGCSSGLRATRGRGGS